MHLKSPAKLNLCLRVIGRRDDGHHALQSLVTFVDVADTLTFTPSDTLSFQAPSHLPLGADNLCLKAAEVFGRAIGASITGRLVLEKDIPVGAGLGGGTMNGAMTLRMLNKLYDYPLAEPDLLGLASHLGADGVVCAYGKPAWVEGTGNRVAPVLAMPKAWAVLVWPGQGLATKQVFTYRPIEMRPLVTPPAKGWTHLPDLLDWLAEEGGNSLLDNAVALLPDVVLAREALLQTDGCLYADMTGSGSACFGLFADASAAQDAARSLKNTHPMWWVRAGRMLTNVFDAA
ncbi:MAG: 4-(cytidine 5'-diphospho)-2-C-methyl-D-erythritol kinase [Proteobacteria bacterium]|nr:4-(cytidine 5'-diphospho)-2-C-methyl-D-erythritol kinase [Pseudomonadota bacterium]